MWFKKEKKELKQLECVVHAVIGDFVLIEFNRQLNLKEVLNCYNDFRAIGIEVVHHLFGWTLIIDIKNYDGSKGEIREEEHFNWKLRSEDD